MRFTSFLMPVIAGTLLVLPAQARDYVSLAGSSTVLPFATIIAQATIYMGIGALGAIEQRKDRETV